MTPAATAPTPLGSSEKQVPAPTPAPGSACSTPPPAPPKTGDGTHEWWLDPAHTWVALRMGDGRWIPHEVLPDGVRQDHGFGPFPTLKATRTWWATRTPDSNPHPGAASRRAR